MHAFALGLLCATAGCDLDWDPPSPGTCRAPAHGAEGGFTGPRSPPRAEGEPVWGVADLHAHPATHFAFGADEEGRGGFLWDEPGLDYDPACEGQLHPIAACNPNTHSDDTDAVRRQARELVLTQVTDQSRFGHGSRGADYTEGDDGDDDAEDAYADWPHGRDIFHQQMQISAIRRAYEGGLRLLVASVTDNAVLTAILQTDAVPGEIDLESDLPSLERQLDYIRAQIARNADWMELALGPGHAERIIRSDKLAVILSLEGDYVPIEVVERWYRDKGVRHVVPVHLVENPVGGSAVYSDIFFSASREIAPLFGRPRALPAIVGAPELSFRLGRPAELVAELAALNLTPVDLELYQTLGAEERPVCGLTGIPSEVGHASARGIDDRAYLRRLFELGLLVDVAHMSRRAVDDTLRLARDLGRPVMNSHTGVRDPCRREGSERDIDARQAACIAALGGVIGLGSPSEAPYRAEGWRGPAVLLSGTGSPLMVLEAAGEGTSSTHRIVASAAPPGVGAIRATAPTALDAGPAPREVRVQLRVDGPELADDVAVFARVELWGGTSREATRTPGRGTSTLRVTLPRVPPPARCGEPDPLDRRIRRIVVGLVERSTCLFDGSAELRVHQLEVDGRPAPLTASHHRLSGERSEVVVVDGEVRAPPWPDGGWRAPDPSDSGYADHVLVRIRSGPTDAAGEAVRGARGVDPFHAGSDLQVRLRIASDAGCRPVDELSCEQVEGCAPPATIPCEAGWASVNRRGAWTPGLEYATYLRCRPSLVCGVDLRLVNADQRAEAIALDRVRVEAVDDPVAQWATDYAELLHGPMADRPTPTGPSGSVALGTDVNGLAPQFAFAKHRFDGTIAIGPRTTSTPPSIGGVPLRFAERGLAGYLLLPELFASVAHRERVGGERRHESPAPRLDGVTESLFRSAQGVIDMWRLAVGTASTSSTARALVEARCGGLGDP